MSCLKYELVSREWFLSPVARLVYRISATISIGVFVLWIARISLGLSLESASLMRLLFFVGAIGAGVTLVGMEFYLFRFDHSHALKQLIWFGVMAIPFLGAPLYCFVVYSRATRDTAAEGFVPGGSSQASPPA